MEKLSRDRPPTEVGGPLQKLSRSTRAINDRCFLTKVLHSLQQQLLSQLRHRSVLTKSFESSVSNGIRHYASFPTNDCKLRLAGF